MPVTASHVAYDKTRHNEADGVNRTRISADEEISNIFATQGDRNNIQHEDLTTHSITSYPDSPAFLSIMAFTTYHLLAFSLPITKPPNHHPI